jgi:hypothetical protein
MQPDETHEKFQITQNLRNERNATLKNKESVDKKENK